MSGWTGAAPGIRTPPMPIEHLDAELLAAPFASDAAFAGALTALGPKLDPKRDQATVRLWRQSERDLLARFPGMSIDELVIRRDCAWFGRPGGGEGPVPLGAVLARAARELVSPAAGLARLRLTPERSEAEQRRHWRWLSFALPADLLLAGAGASCERLEFVSARLRAQLAQGGLAEPHLHLKAAIGFPTLWAALMRALARPDAKASMLEGPGAEWDEGRGLAPLLLACALTRLLLAAFLAEPAFQALGFRRFLDERAGPRLHRRFGATSCCPLWQAAIGLAVGRAPDPDPKRFCAGRGFYAQLIGPERARQSDAELDPVAWWFPPGHSAHPEFRLVQAGLAYLNGRGAGDRLFAQVFWQTQRARVVFYRHVVQRPMVSGLQWFSRTYARLSAPRKPIRLGSFVRQSADLAGAGLRSLEVRVTPEGSAHELVELIGKVDYAAQDLGVRTGGFPPGQLARLGLGVSPVALSDRRSFRTGDFGRQRDGRPEPAVVSMTRIPVSVETTTEVELGVVFHFSRSRGSAAEKGRPSAWARGGNGDPAAIELNPSGYRFSGYYQDQRKGAIALASLLDFYPRMLERVRGIDLCTDELAIPLWVLRPLIRHVLSAGERAAARLHGWEGVGPGPLRVTVHAGEDFVHLLGGIRRVDESVELLGLGEGSRIGHAVSLGIDVREWAARAGRLALPRGERLLDLLWARRVARRIPAELGSWLPWIEQELARLGLDLFGHPLPLGLLDQCWDGLHDARALRAAGFPHGPGPRRQRIGGTVGSPDWLDLVYRWLTDRALFARAQAPVPVDVAREAPLAVALQAHVRGVLGAHGIAVEINPSSNLLIGHLGDLASHPLWRLCPPPGVASDAPGVRVCIGSDDPITFATSLPEEYQLLADALAGAGVGAPDADAWLEAARQCGLATRFTVPRSGLPLTIPRYPETTVPPL
jgi:hypothetical protein